MAEYEARTGRGSSAARGYGRQWQALRNSILTERPVCESPGCDRPALDLHHIVPRRQGGTDDVSNLQGLCRAHHNRETRRERREIGGDNVTSSVEEASHDPSGPRLY
jgi:5-methylcytosine-specific restriction protein A